MEEMNNKKDCDFRAFYKTFNGCHIVKIEMWDESGKYPSWRPITELFCANEEKAKLLTDKINEAFD